MKNHKRAAREAVPTQGAEGGSPNAPQRITLRISAAKRRDWTTTATKAGMKLEAWAVVTLNQESFNVLCAEKLEQLLDVRAYQLATGGSCLTIDEFQRSTRHAASLAGAAEAPPPLARVTATLPPEKVNALNALMPLVMGPGATAADWIQNRVESGVEAFLTAWSGRDVAFPYPEGGDQ